MAIPNRVGPVGPHYSDRCSSPKLVVAGISTVGPLLRAGQHLPGREVPGRPWWCLWRQRWSAWSTAVPSAVTPSAGRRSFRRHLEVQSPTRRVERGGGLRAPGRDDGQHLQRDDRGCAGAELSVDGSIQGPCGGEGTGNHPSSTGASSALERGPSPPHEVLCDGPDRRWLADRANHNDCVVLPATLGQEVEAPRPARSSRRRCTCATWCLRPHHPRRALVRWPHSASSQTSPSAGAAAAIRQAPEAPRALGSVGRRGAPESWLSNYGQLRRNTDRGTAAPTGTTRLDRRVWLASVKPMDRHGAERLG